MKMTSMRNASDGPVRFHIDGNPGVPPLVYDVPPGGVCEVPSGYVLTGQIQKLAPGLVPDDGTRTPVPREIFDLPRLPLQPPETLAPEKADTENAFADTVVEKRKRRSKGRK